MVKRSAKVLSWIAVVLVALILVLLIAIALFDWNRVKPVISARVSEALGRPFAINGDLSVDWHRDRAGGWLTSWLPSPEFTAHDATMANPSWAERPHFAQLDAVRVRLSLLPLFTQRLHVSMVQLVHPTLDLERDKQGRANWHFNTDHKQTRSDWTVSVDTLGFDAGLLTLRDAISDTKLKVTLTPLQSAMPYQQIVATHAADTPPGATASKDAARSTVPSAEPETNATPAYQFAWDAEGSYRGSPLKGHGMIGGVLALQRSDQPFPLRAEVHAGDFEGALTGTLTDPVHLGALDIWLKLSGPSMARLYPITGITLPDTPPFSTEGHLTGVIHDAGSRFKYQDFHGQVGGSDLAGNLLFVSDGKRPKLSGKLHSKVLQFADLAPLVGARARKDPTSDAPRAVQRVLPTKPFRTDRWRAMDADIHYSGAHIVRNEALPIDSLSTHLVMRDGALYLDPLRFAMAGGTVRSNLTLDGSRTPMRGRIKLHARRLQLKQLFPTFDPMKTSFGEINGELELAASGNSIAALLGNADGELKLVMNDGAISKTLLETAGLNVGNIILGKLFGDQTVQINCAAADLSATDGLFDIRFFVFDTKDALIKIDGTINMANERLNLVVEPHTKGVRILSLRSPLYVKGTLKHPDVGVKPGPLLARGAGALALAVVAAPAAALLALIAPSHEGEADNTCRTFLQQWKDPDKSEAR